MRWLPSDRCEYKLMEAGVDNSLQKSDCEDTKEDGVTGRFWLLRHQKLILCCDNDRYRNMEVCYCTESGAWCLPL